MKPLHALSSLTLTLTTAATFAACAAGGATASTTGNGTTSGTSTGSDGAGGGPPTSSVTSGNGGTGGNLFDAGFGGSAQGGSVPYLIYAHPANMFSGAAVITVAPITPPPS